MKKKPQGLECLPPEVFLDSQKERKNEKHKTAFTAACDVLLF